MWRDDFQSRAKRTPTELEGNEKKWLADILAHYTELDYEKVETRKHLESGLAHAQPNGRALAKRILESYAIRQSTRRARRDGRRRSAHRGRAA